MYNFILSTITIISEIVKKMHMLMDPSYKNEKHATTLIQPEFKFEWIEILNAIYYLTTIQHK